MSRVYTTITLPLFCWVPTPLHLPVQTLIRTAMRKVPPQHVKKTRMLTKHEIMVALCEYVVSGMESMRSWLHCVSCTV